MGIGFTYNRHSSAGDGNLRRRRKAAGKLKLVCTHINDIETIADERGKPGFKVIFAFHSPVGMYDFYCTTCGGFFTRGNAERYKQRVMEQLSCDFAGTMKDLTDRTRREQKLTSRLIRLGGPPPSD